jgi:hypothetical protein
MSSVVPLETCSWISGYFLAMRARNAGSRPTVAGYIVPILILVTVLPATDLVISALRSMTAAYQSAMETIAAHERTRLAAVDHEAFFGALDNPPVPSARLKDAFKRHRETVVSK